MVSLAGCLPCLWAHFATDHLMEMNALSAQHSCAYEFKVNLLHCIPMGYRPANGQVARHSLHQLATSHKPEQQVAKLQHVKCHTFAWRYGLANMCNSLNGN